jgi:hypothetical protein
MRRRLLTTSLTLAAAGLTVVAAAGAPAQAATRILNPAAAGDTAAGTYYPVTKNQRVLDTRGTLGGHKGPLGARGELALQVGGVAGVPAGNAASAVVLNLTGVLPTSSTYLTAYPSGTTRPGVSSINRPPKAIRSNLVTVPVGADGKVRIYNNSGSVNVVVDVMGFYARTDIQGTYGVGNMYYPDPSPERIFDSRAVGSTGTLAAGDGVTLSLDYGAADNPNVRAFAVNITAITPNASGFITAWDGSGATPTASSVNFVKGQVVPNMAVVPTMLDDTGAPSIAVVNASPSASTNVAVDIVGVYLAGQSQGLRYTPLTPTRIVDTRTGTGGLKGVIGPKGVHRFQAPGSVAVDATYALVANATAIAPTAGTYVTLYAGGDPRPGVSNLNAATGEIAANAAFINLGPANVFDVYNNSGNINVAVDVAGRLDLFTVPAAPAVGASREPVKPVIGAVTVTRR